MAKRDTIFVCQECGYESPKWMGQCICGAWNSLVEERVAPSGPAKGIGAGAASNPGAARRTGPGGAFATASESAGGAGGARGRAVQLRSVDSSAHGGRMATGISELDRVLGGGLVAGSLTLIAGEPGIGKSTLILQAATRLAALRGTVLYVSGEESAEQLKRRADRITESPVHRNDAVLSHNAAAHNQITSGISHTEPNAMRDQIPNGITHTEPNTTRDQIPNGISHTEPNTMRDQIPNGISHTEPNTAPEQTPNEASYTESNTAPEQSPNGITHTEPNNVPERLYILSETNIENIVEAARDLNPVFLIIDSIQTMYTEYTESAAGSVSQIRACANELMRFAKMTDVPVFIVAHVTKTGELAGPKIIEHLVDCVLQFTGDRTQDIRILRAQKNRFGATNEIGAFEMAEEGLVEIANLSGTLLEDMDDDAEGAVATAVYEGTRPLLLEIQALTAAGGPGFPRRTAIGVELARLNMIIAVLERKAGLDLSAKDVYVNVVGGIKPEGTSIDLAVALAIYSSAKGIPVPPRTCAIGEIGLTGELRSVRGADKMASEAVRLGFTHILLPKKNAARLGKQRGAEIEGVSHIGEALSK